MPKRPSKRVRPQEFPDHEEFEDIKPRRSKYLDDSSDPKPQKETGHTSTVYIEGDVVTCPNKAKTADGVISHGTVIAILGQMLLVLDEHGYIHQCKAYEVYPLQK